MEAFEQLTDALPGSFDGSLVGLAQEGFELGKDLLDRVEVGAVGRQEEELCANGADGSTVSVRCRPRGVALGQLVRFEVDRLDEADQPLLPSA